MQVYEYSNESPPFKVKRRVIGSSCLNRSLASAGQKTEDWLGAYCQNLALSESPLLYQGHCLSHSPIRYCFTIHDALNKAGSNQIERASFGNFSKKEGTLST